IDALPALIESRLRRWGWDFSFLTPDGFARLCARCDADEAAREQATNQAALSWCHFGKNPVTHKGAERAAFRAELRGMTPEMTPEDGERAYPRCVAEYYMKPMIGSAIPEVSPDEEAQLCMAVDELQRLASRETLPAPNLPKDLSPSHECESECRIAVE